MASAPSWPGHAARGLFVLGAREEDVQKLGPSWICAATHTDSLKTRGLPRRSFPCLHPAKPHRGGFLIQRADLGSVYTGTVTPIGFIAPYEITNVAAERVTKR